MWRAARERYTHWLEEELTRVCPEFSIRQKQVALVAARNAAMENDIGPGDPRYPELSDFT
jgi:hypothetical protein